jgi:alkylation response protein AidB-like acyl-CoA dehydrogenase
MDLRMTDEERAKKAEFDAFFEQEMKNAPMDEVGGLEGMYASDEGWAFHRYMMTELAKRKWNIMAWPKDHGGYEASVMEQLLFSESMAYNRAPGIDGFGLRMFAPTLILYATDEQKKRLLPPIANAEVHYCQGWSEPNAGSDLASLTTSAIRDKDHYIVNGQKIWTTGAHRADHMFLLARTDPNSKRSAGLSVFNIDMSWPGIEVRPIMYMNGSHIYNEVYFTDVKVPVEERVGPENDGWKLTRATMNFERSSAGTYAGLRRTFEDLMDYLRNTMRDGKPLLEQPSVRDKVAKLYIDMEIGRALSYKVAWLQDQGNLVFSPSAASEAKVFSSELRQRLVSLATEMFGLYGQVETSKWAPLNGAMIDGYQVSIGSTVCAGSNEIQRNIIAWVGLNLPRFK